MLESCSDSVSMSLHHDRSSLSRRRPRSVKRAQTTPSCMRSPPAVLPALSSAKNGVTSTTHCLPRTEPCTLYSCMDCMARATFLSSESAPELMTERTL